jgi:SAM-dependent methyltransferase
MGWFSWRRKRGQEATARQPEHPSAFLDGRRYLADAPYMLPKDEGEINRLDFQHYMLRYALSGNYAAPIQFPASVLDVGCGTGRWPVEMAREFPGASVTGLDLEQAPETGAALLGKPENYTFVAGDILRGLPFADASFDFVHQRLLMGAIPGSRWPEVVRELARVTRPGGWVELVEAAPALGGGPALATLNRWMHEATVRRGIDVLVCHRLPALLQSAGLTNGDGRELNLPMGRSGGRMGTMAEAQYISLFQGLRGMIVGQGIMDGPSFDETLARAREEMSLTECVSPYYVAYAQRPA